MPEPRFTDDEVRAIFERAAAEQEAERETEGADQDGLTLDDLQRIGAEAGIAPEHVARAARAVKTSGVVSSEKPKSSTFLGMPVEIRATRTLPVSVTDEVWEAIVPDLRRTFKKDGISGEVGRIREWTLTQRNGNGSDHPVKLTLTPEGTGTRAEMGQTMRGSAMGLSIAGGIHLLLALIFGAVSLLAPSGGPPLPVVLMFFTFAATMLGTAQIWLRTHARTQRERFERTLDRIELIARDHAPESMPRTNALPASTTPQLDLDALDVNPVEVPHRALRRKDRS